MVPVSQIELDQSNPRIRKFLEMYDNDPTPDQIFLALGAGNGDESGDSDGPTFQKLKQSIITSGGIIQPVILNRRSDGSLVCIEGNTRVALYQDFLKKEVNGSWHEIPAIVYESIDEYEVHAIRLQAHLVGPRPWDPYSKAKYLHELRHKQLLSFGEIVDFCGGRQKEVVTYIGAYEDMEAYYRPLIEDDSEFDTSRFSGFVELQKPGIKEEITRAGFNYSDFAEWIQNRKIFPLNKVRVLPRILRNHKAQEIFLKENVKAAEAVLDKPSVMKSLEESDLTILARAMTKKLADLPYGDYQKLRNDPAGEAVDALIEVQSSLTEFLKNLS